MKCWMYYPEDNCPFYRCTVFSHYGVGNAPAADKKLKTLRHGDPAIPVTDSSDKEGPYWSLMFEISESNFKPVDLATIVEVSLRDPNYFRVRLIAPRIMILSVTKRTLKYYIVSLSNVIFYRTPLKVPLTHP
jgi:hypothetical protein